MNKSLYTIQSIHSTKDKKTIYLTFLAIDTSKKAINELDHHFKNDKNLSFDYSDISLNNNEFINLSTIEEGLSINQG